MRTARMTNYQQQSPNYIAKYNGKAAFVFGLMNVILGGCAVTFQSIGIALSVDSGLHML